MKEVRVIKAFVPYEQVDPEALRGAILLDGSKMDVVWKLCRESGLRVVADIHTHPGGYMHSSVDRENPMIPEIGHVAIIVPNYADRNYKPGDIGIFEFLGQDQWKDHSRQGRKVFHLEP